MLHGLAFDIGPGKGGHAERYETGFMLAYFPETVDLGALPLLPTPLSNVVTGILDGPTCEGKPTSDYTNRKDPDPRTVSAEEGNQGVIHGVQRIGDQVRAVLRTWSGPNYTAWSPDHILGFDPKIFTERRD